MRALVVEDDRLSRAVLADTLRARGHEVVAFAEAETAWEAYQRQPFQLVILDWMLPGMDGLELCRRMRGLPHGDSSIILVMTAREHPQDLAEVLDAGADDYLPKSAGALLAIRLAIAERRAAGIAARKAAEEAAARAREIEAEAAAVRELNRQQELLLHLITHELNTPLGPIVGYSELLLEEQVDPERLRRGLRAIHQGAERLRALVEDVLALVRLQSGDYLLDILPLDLALALPGWLADLPGASRVSVEVAGDVPIVHVDATRLRKAVRGLVENALKFSAAEAPVEVLAERADGEGVALRVRDHGVGIAPRDQARVFEPLYRTAQAHERAVRGTGLGLALARRIAEVHGGRLELDSQVGVGSTFTMVLPVGGSGDRG